MAIALGTPRARYFDSNGDPLAGGLLYTYVAGTDTPLATYTTAIGDTENENPVVLDANGEASIYLADRAYKFVLMDSLGVTQWTEDGYWASGSGGGGGGGGGGGVGGGSNIEVTNFLDNGGLELSGFGMGGVGLDATTATPINFRARWWGWRGGATGYTISGNSDMGFPRSIKMQRNSGDSSTMSLVVGQHTGYSGLTDVFLIFDNSLNPALPGVAPQFAVISAHIVKGLNFTGSGATIELVSNTGDTNICSGAGWTVESSATLTAAQLSHTAWTRISVSKSGEFAPGSVTLGVRVKFDTPSGTGGTDDYLLVSGIKLELSYTGQPSNYIIPPQYEALVRTRRFYQRIAINRVSGYGSAGGNNDLPIVLETQMMTVPLALAEGTWTVTNCSQPTILDASHYGATLRIVSTALGQYSMVTGVGTWISFNSETQP